MSVKSVLLLCFQVILVKTVVSQFFPNHGSAGWPQQQPCAQTAPSNGVPFTPNKSGGCLIVTSTSPISPTGLNIAADDLVIEGPLDVNGSLPFLGTVALDGSIVVDGSTSVIYGCGNGNVGMTNERIGCGA